MMNASQIYTNDTLATSRKPAAKPASFVLPPPACPKTPLFQRITED